MCPSSSEAIDCQMKTCVSDRKRRSVNAQSPAEIESEAPLGKGRTSNVHVDLARSKGPQNRMRRSTFDKPVFGYLSGEGVKYKKKVKCNDLKCPVNTKCYKLYLANCGYNRRP